MLFNPSEDLTGDFWICFEMLIFRFSFGVFWIITSFQRVFYIYFKLNCYLKVKIADAYYILGIVKALYVHSHLILITTL